MSTLVKLDPTSAVAKRLRLSLACLCQLHLGAVTADGCLKRELATNQKDPCDICTAERIPLLKEEPLDLA